MNICSPHCSQTLGDPLPQLPSICVAGMNDHTQVKIIHVHNVPAISETLKVKINNIVRGIEREKSWKERFSQQTQIRKSIKTHFHSINKLKCLDIQSLGM